MRYLPGRTLLMIASPPVMATIAVPEGKYCAAGALGAVVMDTASVAPTATRRAIQLDMTKIIIRQPGLPRFSCHADLTYALVTPLDREFRRRLMGLRRSARTRSGWALSRRFWAVTMTTICATRLWATGATKWLSLPTSDELEAELLVHQRRHAAAGAITEPATMSRECLRPFHSPYTDCCLLGCGPRVW